MSAYVIGLVKVKDADKWDEYRRRVPATLVPWGARVVFRGRRTDVFSGECDYSDAVVIEFPDREAVQGWYNSSAYQALIPLRNEATDMMLASHEP